jgi:hypothetical protein
MATNNGDLPIKFARFKKNGNLPTTFRVNDIRPYFQNQFCETHIKTVLANYCEGTGYEVKQGRSARFIRVSIGAYKSI